MCKFALRLNEFARGRVKMCNLIIDGIDQFDVFEESLEVKYESQFNSIVAVITQISEHKKPPSYGKRRKLKGFENASEIRTKDLRLYYIVPKGQGYILCLGGRKSNQDKDLRKLMSLEKQIENQIQQHGELKKHQ